MTVPGTAGALLERLGDDAHHSIYDEHGAPVYHRLTAGDGTEVPELLAALEGVRGPVLELACGAGRVTLPLLRAGYDVTALDNSAPMVALLRRRAGGARLRTLVADMREIGVEETFAAAVLATSSVTLLDAEGRAACFAAVRERLRPGGRFLLSTVELTAAGAVDAAPSERALPLPGGGELLDYVDPAAGVRWTTVVVPGEDGEPGELLSSRVRLLRADDLADELDAAGFDVVARHPVDLGAEGAGHEQVLLEAVPRREGADAPARPLAAELLTAPSRFGDPSRTAVAAQGTTVRFADGGAALCGTSGLWNVNLGYGDPAIADAIAAAARDASYLPLFRYGHAPAEAAAAALVGAAAPHRYTRVLFSTAGGAALDAALKVARQRAALAGEPRRRLVVGLRGGYHGLTFGAHGLTGEALGQAGYGIDQKLVRHVAHDDPRELRRLLEAQGDQIAAIVLEPLLGSGAHVVAPEVVEAVLAGRERHGYLVVADEVATGFGRTGPMFALLALARAQPDLLVTSKGLTNGTCAASAVLWAPPVTDAFDRADALLVHGETQAGTPMTCAAIEATIARFGELDALASGARVAARLDAWLAELRAAAPGVVHAVRGAGCFRAIELRDGGTGAPLDAGAVDAVVGACRRAGAIVHPGPSAIQLIPALTYDGADLERLLERVAAVVVGGR